MAIPGADVIETAGLLAWPGIEVEHDGNWVRRWANGYTKRSNSVQSLDVDDVANAPERIAAAEVWFAARGQQPVFRVTPLAGQALVDTLDAAGWTTVDASHLFAMELGAVEADPRGRTYELDDPEFLTAQQRLQGYGDATQAKFRALVAAIDCPSCGILVRDADGVPVASALKAIGNGIVITGNVVTDASRRRQGFGAAMMRTGLAWARANGAHIAALNVAVDNPVGQALYTSLGYSRQYDYVYRVPTVAP